MKKMFLLLASFMAAAAMHAQPQAYEGSIDFQKTTQPAAMIELPYPEAVVEKAVTDYMARKGGKGSDSKGFRIFKGYNLDGQSSDLYFKVDRKSRKEKDFTTVALVFGKSGEEIKTRAAPDNTSMGAARDLLNDMVSSVEAYNLEVQIQDQDNLVKKAQKKYDGLVDDQKDYEKKIKSLQDKLEQNKRDQEQQQTEIDKQKETLETMRGKRKS